MSYIDLIRREYKELIRNRHEEGRFLILISFIITFIISRTIVYGIEYHILNFFPFRNVIVSDVHIHHLVFGIFLILIAGLIRIPSSGDSYIRLASILYGIGAALTLDEFALWLRLDASAYFGQAGRISVDIVILFIVIQLTAFWHAAFWRKLYAITIAFFFTHKK